GHRGVIVNTQRARQLGIEDGDAIEIATPKRSVRGRAVLRQGIRPDTLLMIGQFDHWATPLAKDFGVPSLNTLASMSLDQTDATGSGADIVRVALRKATGPEPARPPRAFRGPGRAPGGAKPGRVPAADRTMVSSERGRQ
ncbi:MAG: molybdopterin dinucleotide binding domain-containing protein, partial [Rubrivivax sp.]